MAFSHHRIAVAIDHSSYSHRALELALSLAPSLSFSVTAYYVLDLLAIEGWLLAEDAKGWGGGTPSLSLAIEAYMEEQARRLEERVETLARTYGVSLSFQILRGVVSEELIRVSGTSDLFFLGKKGEHSRFHNHILGSVTERLARHAHCPVLVASEHPPVINKILVGLDGAEASGYALEIAALLTKLRSAELHLAAVESQIRRATERLEQAKDALLGRGISSHIHPIKDKHPAQSLMKLAEKIGADLIAIGAQGKRGFFSLFGSTSTALLHRSPVHLLITRKKDPPSSLRDQGSGSDAIRGEER